MNELTSFRYIAPLPLYTHSKPYYIFETLPSGVKNTNLEYEDGPAQLVTDIRGRESEFTLKEYGFEFIKWESPELDWGNENELKEIYFPDVRKRLEELLGDEVKRWELYEFRVSVPKGGLQALRDWGPGDGDGIKELMIKIYRGDMRD
jgi:hypothetical protein